MYLYDKLNNFYCMIYQLKYDTIELLINKLLQIRVKIKWIKNRSQNYWISKFKKCFLVFLFFVFSFFWIYFFKALLIWIYFYFVFFFRFLFRFFSVNVWENGEGNKQTRKICDKNRNYTYIVYKLEKYSLGNPRKSVLG